MEEEIPKRPRPNAFLAGLKEHRIYGAGLGYLFVAWIVLQVAAIVLPGFGAPAWALRALMIVLAFGLGGHAADRLGQGPPCVRFVFDSSHTAYPAGLGHDGAPACRRGNGVFPLASGGPYLQLPPNGPGPHSQCRPDRAGEITGGAAVCQSLDRQGKRLFADGVQDEVLTDLAKVADLKVISRTSVMQYRDASRNLSEIGKALGVAYIVEGSVQRANNTIRVTAQLIDARTDTHKWAEKYDRPLEHVFDIQSEIAQAIAGQLQAVISPQEHVAMTELPTHDERAYELYLQARALWNDAEQSGVDYHVILDLLKQSTALDSNFVRAYSLMTEVESYEYFNLERTPETAEAARLYAETAARLRPGSTDTNVAMGFYDYYVRQDFTRARENFAALVRQSPNDARAYFCLGSIERRQGLWEAGLGNLHRALELDPERNSYTETYLEVLMALRRYPEAQAFLDRLISTHPRQFWLRVERASLWLDWKADTRAARAELADLPPGNGPDVTVTGLRFTCDEYDRDFASAQRIMATWPLADFGGLPRAMYEGDVARLRGDAQAAEMAYKAVRPAIDAVVHAQPDNCFTLMQLAALDASMGNKDTALQEGRRALVMAPHEDTQFMPRLKALWVLALTRLGEREEAIHTLQTLVGQPYGPDYGDLRLNPEWDTLRSDPRFVAMLASLTPKS